MMIHIQKYPETKFIMGKLWLMCDDIKPYTFVCIRIMCKMKNKAVSCQNKERKFSFSLDVEIIRVKS